MACSNISVSVEKKEIGLDVHKTILNYSGSATFLSLLDTPDSYSSKEGNLLKVNSSGTGIEFVEEINLDWENLSGDQSIINISGFTNDSNFISNLNSFTTDNLSEGLSNKYDKTVSLNAGDGIEVTGSYPTFTIKNISEGNKDHSQLFNLDYENSGHTGFQPAGSYLTSETDPVFTSSPAKNVINTGDGTKFLSDDNTYKTITIPDGSKWESDGTGYIKPKNSDKVKVANIDGALTSESDPIFSGWDKSTGISITESQISDFGDYLTDASSDNKTYGRKNGAWSEVTGGSGGASAMSDLTDVDLTGLANNKILKYNSTSTKWEAKDETGTTYTAGTGIDITSNVISNTFTETDPVFTSWDKSTGISITESQISDFGNYLTSETDPLSVHLDQTIPQTFTAGDVSGSGLLKVTLGVLGLDTTTYVTGTPWTSEGYITDANSDGKIYGRKDGGWTEVTSGGATNLVDLGDVDDTAKATGKILQVNSDGDHEYVDLPDPDVSGLVPYTGATNDVDLGNYDLTATDITSEGNIYIANSEFIKGTNYAGDSYVDTIKVNEDDNIEIGADLEVGDFILEATSEPATPEADSKTIYVTASGTTPNRQVVMKIKDEAGQEVILSSLIV